MPTHTSTSIIGRKGGGKGGANSGRTSAREAPNTLSSRSHVRIVDVLSEGPIQGLVCKSTPEGPSPYRSIYFDGVPLQNSDGSFNFTLTRRPEILLGYPATSTESGIAQLVGDTTTLSDTYQDVENEVRIGRTVLHDIPIIHSIPNTEANRIRLKIRIPILTFQSSNGDTLQNSVQFRFSIKRSSDDDSSWRSITSFQNGISTKGGVITLSGKSNSAYVRDYLFYIKNVPSENIKGIFDEDEDGPYLIRMERVSPDSTTIRSQNTIIFDSLTTIIDGEKFLYPDTALIALSADAENFSSIPTRTYEIEGRIISVPDNRRLVTGDNLVTTVSNYTPQDIPLSRVQGNAYNYIGDIWSGHLIQEYSDNPAWILWDILTSKTFGLGIDPSKLNAWAFYQAGKYCDELIPDGTKNKDGAINYARRYTFNGVLNKSEDAYSVINSITSGFRAITIWGSNQVFPIQDRPEQPVQLVVPENVENGEFNYEGVDIKSLHSSIRVSWNNPDDQYRLAVEVVENNEFHILYGFNPLDIALPGCTNRSEAYRFAWRTRDEEIHGKEIVKYRCGLDHAALRPGQIIAIQDPTRNGIKSGGRCSVNGSIVTFDQPLDSMITVNDTIKLMLKSGVPQNFAIKSLDQTNRKSLELHKTPDTVDTNVVYIITGLLLSNDSQNYGYQESVVLYRILDIVEVDIGLYEITGIFYDDAKYKRTEAMTLPDTLSVSSPPTTVLSPTNISASISLSGILSINFTPSSNNVSNLYRAYVEDSLGNEYISNWVPNSEIELQLSPNSTQEGSSLTIRIQAADSNLLYKSSPVEIFHRIDYDNINLEIINFSAIPSKDVTTLSWDVSDQLPQNATFEIYEGSTPNLNQLSEVVKGLPATSRRWTTTRKRTTYWIRIVTEHANSEFRFARVRNLQGFENENLFLTESINAGANRILTNTKIGIPQVEIVGESIQLLSIDESFTATITNIQSGEAQTATVTIPENSIFKNNFAFIPEQRRIYYTRSNPESGFYRDIAFENDTITFQAEIEASRIANNILAYNYMNKNLYAIRNEVIGIYNPDTDIISNAYSHTGLADITGATFLRDNPSRLYLIGAAKFGYYDIVSNEWTSINSSIDRAFYDSTLTSHPITNELYIHDSLGNVYIINPDTGNTERVDDITLTNPKGIGFIWQLSNYADNILSLKYNTPQIDYVFTTPQDFAPSDTNAIESTTIPKGWIPEQSTIASYRLYYPVFNGFNRTLSLMYLNNEGVPRSSYYFNNNLDVVLKDSMNQIVERMYNNNLLRYDWVVSPNTPYTLSLSSNLPENVEGSHIIETDLGSIISGTIESPDASHISIADPDDAIGNWEKLVERDRLGTSTENYPNTNIIFDARWRNSAGDDYTEWTPTDQGSDIAFNARYLQLRTTLMQPIQQRYDIILNLPSNWLIDIPPKTANGNGISSETNATQINFTQEFLQSPNVVVTIINGVSGDYITLNTTKTNFTVEIRNASGQRVARGFNWIARGV